MMGGWSPTSVPPCKQTDASTKAHSTPHDTRNQGAWLCHLEGALQGAIPQLMVSAVCTAPQTRACCAARVCSCPHLWSAGALLHQGGCILPPDGVMHLGRQGPCAATAQCGRAQHSTAHDTQEVRQAGERCGRSACNHQHPKHEQQRAWSASRYHDAGCTRYGMADRCQRLRLSSSKSRSALRTMGTNNTGMCL